MKLYLAAGRYVGTQAEAKKLDKEFTEVNVPVDKEGLIAYLNDHCHSVGSFDDDAFETVVERQDPPMEVEIPQMFAVTNLDELFQAAPLGQQLTLASIALEEARSHIRQPIKLRGFDDATPVIEDDEMFS